MSALQWLGAALLALPFVGLFAWIAHEEGLRVALAIFGGSAALVGIVTLGAHLLTGGA